MVEMETPFCPLLYSPPTLYGLRQPAHIICQREGYHAVITTNIRVKGMARQLEGNMRTDSGGGSVTARGGRLVGVDPWAFFLSLQCSVTANPNCSVPRTDT
jgi:hypothetical protein